MSRSLKVAALFGAALALSVLAGPGSAAPAKRRKRPSPTATATPMPTPPPLRKAAGAVVDYLPGKHIVVAELGSTGRVFSVDGETQIEAEVRTGARVRILFFDGPDGPVARQILPGPTLETPAPPRK